MPTKKKRVGFIPREDVMKIIDKLSLENNLSNSKIISILIEEALSRRGLFNKNTGKEIKLYQELNNNSKDLTEECADFNDNEESIIKNKVGNYKKSPKTALLKKASQDIIDMQTYEKFLSFLKFQEMMDEYNT